MASKLVEFGKTAQAKAKQNRGGAVALVENKPITGYFVNREKPAGCNSNIITLSDDKGVITKYWSFSLLDYFMGQQSITKGDMVYICRLPKQKITKGKWRNKMAWGCDFWTEKV